MVFLWGRTKIAQRHSAYEKKSIYKWPPPKKKQSSIGLHTTCLLFGWPRHGGKNIVAIFHAPNLLLKSKEKKRNNWWLKIFFEYLWFCFLGHPVFSFFERNSDFSLPWFVRIKRRSNVRRIFWENFDPYFFWTAFMLTVIVYDNYDIDLLVLRSIYCIRMSPSFGCFFFQVKLPFQRISLSWWLIILVSLIQIQWCNRIARYMSINLPLRLQRFYNLSIINSYFEIWEN